MKLFIATALICAIAALGLIIWRRLASALDSLSKKPQEGELARLSAQSLICAHDFQGHCLITTFGQCVVAFEVEGASLALASDEEKDAQVSRLASALAGERNPYAIYRLLVPVDAGEQVSHLEGELRAIGEDISCLEEKIAGFAPGKAPFALAKKLKALSIRRDYISRAYLPLYGAQATAFRSKAYVVLSFDGAFAARERAMKAAEDFMRRLFMAGYQTHLLEPAEMIFFLKALNGRFPQPGEQMLQDAPHLYEPLTA